ncbi:MAG: arylsulfatase [Actinobacteria bacterium]|nr:arylsulfatase [Actinomycetota bacterium]
MTHGNRRHVLPFPLLAISVAVWQIGAAAADRPEGRQNLPIQQSPFQGRIGLTPQTSTPAWPSEPAAPGNAPNVLIVLTDDIGFGVTSTFGGPIPTPALDRLAGQGLRYNEFHTTAMCAPTRAAMLTGRNHQAVGNGAVMEVATGYPGYRTGFPRSAASLAEVLKDNGYNTAQFGKHHNVPAWNASVAGPYDEWPIGLGFEYFYGFLGGETDQWHPVLYRNTVRVPEDKYNGKTTLDHELADDAIDWIHRQKAAAPGKPFFVYYAPGTGHAPHQAPAEWIDRFEGRFDAGWDRLREEIFARQKSAGIIPGDATLTPRPAELPAWDSLSDVQKRIDARYMEVFAGMVAYQDEQIGRILTELDRMGQRNNTLVIFIAGDNGASGEGTPSGTLNDLGLLANRVRERPEWVQTQLQLMGSERTSELYPAGWAWALDTPFQWMKQVASHLGGTRTGMVVCWPDRIPSAGQIRSQFTHVTDIYPTVLESIGLPVPTRVNGVAQQRLDGVSLAYTFDHPEAPERHSTQYFEMTGNLGIYHDGWLANTKVRRLPWEQMAPEGATFSNYQWELYDLKHDYSQSQNLAARYPDKVEKMKALWLAEAKRNQVLPVQDALGFARAMQGIEAHAPEQLSFSYWGAGLSVADGVAPSFTARSFSITADVEVPAANTTGVLLARGSWFGGWSFYLKDGRPVAYEALSTQPGHQWKVASAEPLGPGPAELRFDFTMDTPFGLGKGGTMKISVNGLQVAEGRIERTILSSAGTNGESFDIGHDTGVPVTDDYAATGRFPGRIVKVQVDLAPIDIKALKAAAEAAEASARRRSQ